MKKAFVIMCNDFPQAICLGNEATAIAAAERMRQEDYQKNRHAYRSEGEHRHKTYWRATDVPVVP